MTPAQYAVVTESLRSSRYRTETQERLVALLLGGRMCTSDLLAALQISRDALKTAMHRMRVNGWIVECDRIEPTEALWSLRLPERTCITLGCTTRLSRYNPGLHCYAHGGGWLEEPPVAKDAAA